MAMFPWASMDKTSPQNPGTGITFNAGGNWDNQTGYSYYFEYRQQSQWTIMEGATQVADDGWSLGAGPIYPGVGTHNYTANISVDFEIWDGYYYEYAFNEQAYDSAYLTMVISSPSPTVTSLNGGTACNIGSAYNIVGTNFTGATAVSINGVSASYSVTNSTTISVTIPQMGTYGTSKDVSVTNSSGTGSNAVGNIASPGITISTPGMGGYCLASSTVTCTASVSNLANTTINWTCSGGSFSPTSTSSGGNTTWTAPASPSSNGAQYTLTATAAGNSAYTSYYVTRFVYYQPYGSLSSSALNVINTASVTLTYSTTYATSNSNNWSMSTANLSGTSVVTPASNTSTTYSFMSINPAYAAGPYQVTVTAMAAPTVTSFTSSPASGSTITNGSTVALSWATSNATSTSTNFGSSATSGSGVTVTPGNSTTTTYTVAAVNNAATSSASSVTIYTVAAPVISSYGADTYNLITGHSTGIRMSFSSATVARIGTSGAGSTEVTASAVSGTTYTVSPTVTTTYYFYVANAAGSTSTGSFTITVYPVATLVNNGPILLNGTVTLTTVFSVGTGSLSVPTVAPGTWGAWATGTGQTVALPYNKRYTLTQNTAGQSPTSDTVYNVPQAKMPTTASPISLSQVRQLTTGGGSSAIDMNDATVRTLATAGGSGTSISFSQFSGKYLGTGTYFT